MAALPKSDVADRRLRVIQDALWQLQQDYAAGALACLLGEVNRTHLETKKVNVTYLPRMRTE